MIFKLFRLALKKNRLGKHPTRVGQKVVLTTDCTMEPSETAPIEGTSYECGGTVLSMEKCKNTAHVKWYNNYSNAFRVPSLRVISNGEYIALMNTSFSADNPNVTFKQKKDNCKMKPPNYGSPPNAPYYHISYTDY